MKVVTKRLFETDGGSLHEREADAVKAEFVEAISKSMRDTGLVSEEWSHAGAHKSAAEYIFNHRRELLASLDFVEQRYRQATDNDDAREEDPSEDDSYEI